MEKAIGFIGAGNMGTAIIEGLVTSKIAKGEQIYAYSLEPDDLKAKAVRLGFTPLKSNRRVLEKSDVIFLAIKPQGIKEVLEEIQQYARPEQIFISMVAGISIKYIKSFFNFDAKVIRIMPNTPALIGQGMTGMSTTSPVKKEEVQLVQTLLSSFSLVEEVAENLLDAVTAIGGSSPAYVDLFIEALADGGVLLGLPREKAYRFAAQSLLGAAKMVLDTQKHPGELKDAVCSPAGTTIAAVRQLEKHGFRNAIIEAMIAAHNRSKEMGNLFEK